MCACAVDWLGCEFLTRRAWSLLLFLSLIWKDYPIHQRIPWNHQDSNSVSFAEEMMERCCVCLDVWPFFTSLYPQLFVGTIIVRSHCGSGTHQWSNSPTLQALTHGTVVVVVVVVVIVVVVAVTVALLLLLLSLLLFSTSHLIPSPVICFLDEILFKNRSQVLIYEVSHDDPLDMHYKILWLYHLPVAGERDISYCQWGLSVAMLVFGSVTQRLRFIVAECCLQSLFASFTSLKGLTLAAALALLPVGSR